MGVLVVWSMRSRAGGDSAILKPCPAAVVNIPSRRLLSRKGAVLGGDRRQRSACFLGEQVRLAAAAAGSAKGNAAEVPSGA